MVESPECDMRTKLSIACGVAVATVATVGLVVACRFFASPSTDQARYNELRRFGSRYKAAWTGKPQILERGAAILRVTGLTNYYRTRLEADSKALLASGYFVHISVPVPDLKARIPWVRTALLNTAQTRAPTMRRNSTGLATKFAWSAARKTFGFGKRL
jgi:hypothetical protein